MDNGFPERLAGNTNPLPCPSRTRASSRMSKARAASGTRCSRRAIMRDAGRVQVSDSQSISGQVASLTSLDRAAVRTRNSKESRVLRTAVDSRTCSRAAGTSA